MTISSYRLEQVPAAAAGHEFFVIAEGQDEPIDRVIAIFVGHQERASAWVIGLDLEEADDNVFACALYATAEDAAQMCIDVENEMRAYDAQTSSARLSDKLD